MRKYSNANHGVTYSPSLAENDSRLLKNSKGNLDGEWIFCRRKEADVEYQDHENLRSKLNQSIIAQNTITNQRTSEHDTNKTD